MLIFFPDLESIMINQTNLRCALGLDLGGTNIKAAVISERGAILDQTHIETPAGREVPDVVAALVELSQRFLQPYPDIAAMGLGAPGLVDESRRIVRLSPNFPTWNDVPLVEMLEARLNLPMILENDANCFGLAESRWGAGKGVSHLLALTVGTGIGGAIILDGKIYRGDSGAAGELGHISVDLWGPKCRCGNRGCVERYLGEQWFTQAARNELDDDTIKTPADVSDRAARGDQKALRFIEGRGEILGVACTSLIHAFDPETIVIGGGIAQAGEPFFRGIRTAIQQRAYPVLAAKVKITPARLGTMAGAMGAAALGFSLENQP